MKEKQICTQCIMSNVGDDLIKFDEDGKCNYCTKALKEMDSIYFPNEIGEEKIQKMVEKLKKENKDKKYDCFMGISGGLDSSYLAYLGAKKWGLRILAVHVDDGFDEEITKENLKNLVDTCGFDLITVKPDAEQFCDLTRAFFLAGVPNLAIPQDNILFEVLYSYTRKYKINTFLSGKNFSLECVLQAGNTHGAFDVKHIKDIHKRFGRKPINKLKFLTYEKKFLDKYLLNMETLCPLDYINYNRKRALEELHEFCNYQYYGNKHLENKLTKFIQTYYLYHKFNVDKRKSHLSSMIVSNQMTREEALKEMAKPPYDEVKMKEDILIILKALDLTYEEFEQIMKEKPHNHTDYKYSNFEENKTKIGQIIRKFVALSKT